MSEKYLNHQNCYENHKTLRIYEKTQIFKTCSHNHETVTQIIHLPKLMKKYKSLHVIFKGPGLGFSRISCNFQGPRPRIFKDFT